MYALTECKAVHRQSY